MAERSRKSQSKCGVKSPFHRKVEQDGKIVTLFLQEKEDVSASRSLLEDLQNTLNDSTCEKLVVDCGSLAEFDFSLIQCLVAATSLGQDLCCVNVSAEASALVALTGIEIPGFEAVAA
jgi:anti-anti-sigma regulatory factor